MAVFTMISTAEPMAPATFQAWLANVSAPSVTVGPCICPDCCPPIANPLSFELFPEQPTRMAFVRTA